MERLQKNTFAKDLVRSSKMRSTIRSNFQRLQALKLTHSTKPSKGYFMLKKTLTFKDLDGNPITEDFYFNLNTSELAKLQLSHEGGFGDYLEKISAKRSGREVMDTFEDILRMSVGRRGEDNRKFIKTDEIRDDFMFSGAYDVL